jgi:hypothetical protein
LFSVTLDILKSILETPSTKTLLLDQRDTDFENDSEIFDDTFQSDDEFHHRLLHKYGFQKILKPIDEKDRIEVFRRAKTDSSIGAYWKVKFDEYMNFQSKTPKSFSIFTNPQTSQSDIVSKDHSEAKIILKEPNLPLGRRTNRKSSK